MYVNLVRLEMIKEKEIAYSKRKIVTSKDLAQLGFELIARADREMLVVVCMDVRLCINAIHVAAIGSLNLFQVQPREVYKAAVVSNSHSIALLHNHPSGNPSPSAEDVEATKRIIEAGRILDIRVIDHLVIGDRSYFSILYNREYDFP